jgi:hypothetical protein
VERQDLVLGGRVAGGSSAMDYILSGMLAGKKLG